MTALPSKPANFAIVTVVSLGSMQKRTFYQKNRYR